MGRVRPWLTLLLPVGLCAVAYWLAYSGYKSYAEHVVFRELEPALRLEANHSIRLAVGLFAAQLVVQAVASRAFARSRLRPDATLGLLAGVVVHGVLLRILFGGADARVQWVLALGCATLLCLATLFAARGGIYSFVAPRWKQLGLGVTSLVLALEIGLRIVHLASYAGTLEDLSRDPRLPAAGAEVRLRAILAPSPEPGVVYALKPGLDVRFQGVRVTTNAEGWRDEQRPLVKPPGTIRIIGLGDSVMFGWGVEAQERYMDRLEERLAEAYPEVRWETIVSAVPGYNLAMEVASLRARGLAHAPDLIVYGFVGNDFALPNFLQTRVRVLSLRSFIAFYSRLAWARSAALLTSEIEGGAGGGPIHLVADPERVPPEYRDSIGKAGFARALDRLLELAGDVPVVYFSFEGAGGFAREDIPGPIHHHDASAERARMGARFDLSGDDPHPSVEGHGALADSLFAYLVRSGIADAAVRRALGPSRAAQ